MIWSYTRLKAIDFRFLPIIASLMLISLLVISSYSVEGIDPGEEGFFTSQTKSQVKWFAMGIGVFLFFSGLDYHKIREWTWFLYLFTIISLVGLFFSHSIQSVHRWYRIPFLGMSIQPSEYAKLVVVISLSWYLERAKTRSTDWSVFFIASLIVGIPFLLILRQPDLGTALVLLPMTLVMFYLGSVHPLVVRCMTIAGGVALLCVVLLFLDVIPHERVRPIAGLWLKEYQLERLNPHTHHQKAAQAATAIGGVLGVGWRKSSYTSQGWLPAPYTDSVFPAFGEEFGLLGLLLLLFLFYALLFLGFQVTAVAKDDFGRLLAAGITVYLAMHILINIGMMAGFLPITGVPLVLVSYGGSSLLITMMALGLLQSIYSRRFLF